MNGSALHESVIPGYQTSYRFHLADPIHFARQMRVTMEHGHANHLADDWSSTAYWYQTLPSPPSDILPVEARLPIVLDRAPGGAPQPARPSAVELTGEMQQSLSRAEARYKEYIAQRDREVEKKIARTRRYSQGNIEQVRKLRESFG